MVDAVPRPVVPRVVTLARTFALGVARVVADEPGAAHQEVKQEAEHLHADGDEEEDEGVPPLVRDQQLGEDAREGDDHPRCAWKHAGQGGTGGTKVMGRVVAHMKEAAQGRFWTHSLRSSPPACTSWAASPCNHRNWTAELGRDEEEVYYRLLINRIRARAPPPPLRETGDVITNRKWFRLS